MDKIGKTADEEAGNSKFMLHVVRIKKYPVSDFSSFDWLKSRHKVK